MWYGWGFGPSFPASSAANIVVPSVYYCSSFEFDETYSLFLQGHMDNVEWLTTIRDINSHARVGQVPLRLYPCIMILIFLALPAALIGIAVTTSRNGAFSIGAFYGILGGLIFCSCVSIFLIYSLRLSFQNRLRRYIESKNAIFVPRGMQWRLKQQSSWGYRSRRVFYWIEIEIAQAVQPETVTYVVQGMNPNQVIYPQGQVVTGYPQGQMMTGQVVTGYPQGQMPTGYPQGQMPTGYPQGQMPTGYPQGQMPTGYPQGQMPTGYPQGQMPTGYPQGQVPPPYNPNQQTVVPPPYNYSPANTEETKNM